MDVNDAIQQDFGTPFFSKPEVKQIAASNIPMSDAEKMRAQQNFTLKQMALNNQYDMNKIATQFGLNQSSDIQKSYLDMISRGIDPTVADTAIRTATNNWTGAS
jgi:hypothetical protein